MTQYGTLSPEAAPGYHPGGERPSSNHADRSLLIVDDDKPFSTRLARAMEARGYGSTWRKAWQRASRRSRPSRRPSR